MLILEFKKGRFEGTLVTSKSDIYGVCGRPNIKSKRASSGSSRTSIVGGDRVEESVWWSYPHWQDLGGKGIFLVLGFFE